MPLSPEAIRELARIEAQRVADERDARIAVLVSTAVRETLIQLGVSTAEPIELQKDFAHLRKWRMAVDGASAKAAGAALTVIVTGTIGALWLGFKTIVGK